jgi:hypothetical protein
MMKEILQDEERRKEELAQLIEQEAKAAAEVIKMFVRLQC